MLLSIPQLLLTVCLVACVSSLNLRPLRAGSIEIRDSDIRKEKNFTRKIDLKLSAKLYADKKDLNVVASITSLTMDDQLSFYFDYSIDCSGVDCVLLFDFIRKTEAVSPAFRYYLKVDYLVARGFRIMNLNMTSYQEHLMIKDLVSYDENNQLEDLAPALPRNN
jgi:hypothetical protein